MQKQGREATEGIFGDPHAEAQYLINRFRIDDIAYFPSVPFKSFILVDASDLVGMPDVIMVKDVIEVIDHREFHKTHELFPNAKIQIEKVGAAATLITEKYQEAKMQIDSKSAILLYGAIHSNTLNLKSTVSTQRDKNAIDWLQKQTQIPNGLIHDMFVAKTEVANEHIEKVLQSDWKEFTFDSRRIGIVQLEVIGLDALVRNHLAQILRVLDDLIQKHGLQFAFFTAVDLEQGFNLFITNNVACQSLLSKVFGVEFKNHIGKKRGLLLRKELIPLISSQFDKTK